MNFIVGLLLMAASVRAASNAVCNIEAGKQWTCTPSKACPNPEPRLSHICNSPHEVCCPPARKSRATITASVYCSQLWSKMCKTKMRNRFGQEHSVMYSAPIRPSISGGVFSLPMEHPYMARIGKAHSEGVTWFCGGTLISERYVLSAAHCELSKPNVIRLGELDFDDNAEVAEPEDFVIEERLLHPEYNSTTYLHDIALYRLARDVVFSIYKRPACLHTQTAIPYRSVTAAGWGRMGSVLDESSQLMEVELSITNVGKCAKKNLPLSQIKGKILCATGGGSNRDTCQGDSGGPILTSPSNSCLKRVVGVTSTGGLCGSPFSYGSYTKVSYYLPWIQSVVWA